MSNVDSPIPWRVLLLTPVVVSFFLLAVPQYYFISTSFHANLGYGHIGEAFTLENYGRIFTDPLYLDALMRTFALSGISAGICLALGFPVAYVLARMQSRWTGLLLGLLVATTFITPVVKDIGLIILLSTSGMANRILEGLGIISTPMSWMGSFPGVLVGLTHYMLPLVILLLITVIQTVPRSLEDAAHAHGASRLRVFCSVIIPIVKPGLVAATLMVFNLGIGAFTTPALLGGGRVLTFPVLIQRSVILDVDYPFAAGLSTVLLLSAFIINVLAGYLMIKQIKGKKPHRKASKQSTDSTLLSKGI